MNKLFLFYEMEVSDVNKIIFHIWIDKYARYSFFAIFVVGLNFLFLRFTSGVLIFASYLGGFIVFNYLSKYKNQLEQLIANSLANKGEKPEQHKADSCPIRELNSNCSICGKGKCIRERITYGSKPWDGLLVPESVDDAIEKLLNRILNEFVTSWYRTVSSDDDFPVEVRSQIRYAASSIIYRALKLDLGRLISEKLVTTATRHVDGQIRRLSVPGQMPCLHPIIYNREMELNYLRALTSKLLPFVLPQPHLNCQNYSVLVREIVSGWLLLPLSDVLCDPGVLNSLVVLMLGRNEPLTQYPINDPKLKKVEFLAKFVTIKSSKTNSALQPEMCSILKDQSLLYSFMQFLKTQNAVNILQFCLNVEDFNRKMLTPDLSTDDLDQLYKDAWDLYSLYFSQKSPDALPFPEEYVFNMRKVLSKDVTKLRTSPTWFQAYEFAYNLLDNVYCQQFHNSDDFYTWLCGPRMTIMGKSTSGSPSLPESPAKNRFGPRNPDGSSSVFRIGSKLNKIKGALKSQSVMEGQAFSDSILDLETDSEYAEALQLCENERDLSTWRVSIPTVVPKLDPTTNKINPVYIINVQRIDITEGNSSQWTVERKLVDFYTLEAKLAEFHGEFTDAQLPSRRFLNSNGPGSRMESPYVYEEYLQKLLSKPALRGSDLLFSFLSCSGEFVVEASALSRLLRRSVPLPISLRKERGQNLDPFISSFFNSTESRPKNSKIEWKDMSEELSPRKQRNIAASSVYGDNLGIKSEIFLSAQQHQSKLIATDAKINTLIECLIYFVVKVIHFPRPVLRLILALHSFFGNIFDILLMKYLNNTLNSLLVPPRLAHLINLLEWSVFDNKNKINREQVSVNAKQLIDESGYITNKVYLALYSAVQNPIQNKQLFYVLLDTCIVELFPELKTETAPDLSSITNNDILVATKNSDELFQSNAEGEIDEAVEA